jgi:hypothetical protein
MKTVFDIIFGAPPMTTAKASQGTFDESTKVLSVNNSAIVPLDALGNGGKIKVQYSIDGGGGTRRPQPQKVCVVTVGATVTTADFS